MKQSHYAWVCVGKNHGEHDSAWFYAFRTCEKAREFEEKSKAIDDTVEWRIYPCEFETVDEALKNFEYCSKFHREVKEYENRRY